jgi:hypothetical protein
MSRCNPLPRFHFLPLLPLLSRFGFAPLDRGDLLIHREDPARRTGENTQDKKPRGGTETPVEPIANPGKNQDDRRKLKSNSGELTAGHSIRLL